jgi:pseudouridylate synthase
VTNPPRTVRSEEVEAAFRDDKAVVALESTIVAHGLPWPHNLEVAQELEATVRAQGAVPATIAVVDGVARVGLSAAELERLARQGERFVKVGAADLSVVMAREGCGATTVSATAFLAAGEGIPVFATGGIGGVHRGDAFDVSHDLVSISRLQIAVVSAGAKSLLDLPRTLEALETLGVLVLGYRCDELPAFYCRSSGLRLPHRADTIDDLATILFTHWRHVGAESGALIANPIPAAAELPRELIEPVVAAAIERATAEGISGKALTPFLLAEIAKVTGGRAVAANRALAVHNAEVGGQLSVALTAQLVAHDPLEDVVF